MQDEFLDKLNKKRAEKQAADELKQRHDENVGAVKASGETVSETIERHHQEMMSHEPNVSIKNEDLAKTDDVQEVVDSINKLNITTFIASKDSWANVVESLASLSERMQGVVRNLETGGVQRIEKSFTDAVTSLNTAVSKLKTVRVEGDADQKQLLADIKDALTGLEISPQVTVPTPKVTVQEREVDLRPLVTLLQRIEAGIEAISGKEITIDVSSIQDGLSDVEKAVRDLIARPIPVPETPLPFKNASNQGVQASVVTSSSDSTKIGVVVLNPDGSNISGGSGGSGTAAYSDSAGTDRKGLVDADRHVQTDVLSSALPTGAATSAKQDTGNTSLSTIAGAVSGTEMQVDVLTMPITTVQATNLDIRDLSSASDSVTADTELTTADLDTGAGTDTRAVVGLVGSASGGGQLIPGSTTDGLLVNLGANNDVTGSVTANAGTNLNTSALALESGGNLATIAGAIKAEDAVHTTGDSGIQVLTKRTDTAASSAGTDGDYATLNTDNTGRVWVRVGATDSLTPGTSATHLGKAEDAAHASGDTGIFILGVRNDNASTTFGADGDYGPVATDLKGRVSVRQIAATATLSNVSSSATNVTILAANSARVGATVYNDSTQILYLKFGTTASTSSFTVKLAADTYYEVPGGYTGIMDGIWASANGSARVTELT